MKKLCILATGLMVATATVSANAQSSVTVFGTLDLSVAHLSGTNSSNTGLSNSGDNISRIGFRGIEDLGGGLAAGFWLEAGLYPDTGAGAGTSGTVSFNRRSTVSLVGPFGEVRLGRDDSAGFLNTLIFDPFLTNGVAGTMAFSMGPATPITQISNAVSYFTPASLGGFYGQVQYAPGEQVGSPGGTSAGDYAGLRVGYLSGPWHVAAATAKLKGQVPGQDVRLSNLGLSYDFDVVKPMLLVAQERRGNVEVRMAQLGAVIQVGAGVIRLSAGHYNTMDSNANWNKYAIGYGYNLSRRTQLYTSYARVYNAAGAMRSIGTLGLTAPGTTLGGDSSGYEAGIRHFF